MTVPAQSVEFCFLGPPLQGSAATERLDYAGFSLNHVEYKVGDCVYLYPEGSGPDYLGQIRSCFQDTTGRAQDTHCVEVAWFERRAHLEDAAGTDCPQGAAKEVVALEETDINPIGCISGKALVFKAPCYEEACQMATTCGVESLDWFFCRGIYKQSEKCVIPFPEFAELLASSKRMGKRAKPGTVGSSEVVADSDDVKRQRFLEEQPAAPMRRTGKLVSGRTCVECGATQTPQWREGPAGPKTLCNACGVRYGRAQQRANKRPASSGASRPACGGGGRNGRTAKAARAEAAPVPRRVSTTPASEEASQRPLRQAALMSASRTAAYARTGVFPLDSAELEAQMAEVEAGPEVQGAERAQPASASATAAQQQAAAQAALAAAGFPVASTATDALPLELAAAAGLAGGACGTANGMPSFGRLSGSNGPMAGVKAEPAESGAEGCGGQVVAVEVVVDGCEAGGGAASGGTPFLTAGLPFPLLPGQQPLLLSPSIFTDSGAMSSAAADAATAAAAAAVAAVSYGCETPLPLPPAPAVAVNFADAGLMSRPPSSGDMAAAGVIGEAEADACTWMLAVPAGRLPGPCAADDQDDHDHLCVLHQEPMEAAEAAEAHLAAPSLSGGGGACGAAADAVVSAPVSPSACGGSGCANGYGGADVDVDCYYAGDGGCGTLYDDEYGPLGAGVDYGLGGAEEGLGCGGLFDCELQPGGAAAEHCDAAAAVVAVGSAADMPALAAAAARYAPEELAPGTAARGLLDALPCLAAAAPAPPSAAPPLLPASAVAPLVALGREVSHASCEAVAADAALHAVNQVLGAHQEAARRAREASEAHLGRLNSCLSHLAGPDAAAAALAGMGVGAARIASPAAAAAATSGPSHLIDLRDLCGGGMAGYGRDAELFVAVRS